MKLIEIIFIAFGLSLDAFAVSVASGLAIRESRVKHALRMALAFGGFQAIMPLIGWLAGIGMKGYIEAYDHWIAFGVLSALGFKMIYEAKKIHKAEKKLHKIGAYLLLTLAIATSIDALAVGATFAMLDVAIVWPAVIIGAITFIVCYIGFMVGNKLGSFFETKIEIFAGLVLIGIGLKIFIEHISA